jgi:carbohydrate binding protein with CBM11 domain
VEEKVIAIQTYVQGLGGVHASNPDVHLSIGRDPARGDEPVLFVDYPAPSGDPAGRDVRCEAENRDWRAGNAVAFVVRATQARKLSVSFFDKNRVAYTHWVELSGDGWQPVRVAFADIRPNPYFQLPDANRGAPLDVSEVSGLAFAPQDPGAGQLVVSRIEVVP